MAVAMLLVIPLLQYSCAQTFETQLPMHCGHACFVGMLGRWYLYGTWLVKLAILVAGLFPTVKIYEDCGSSIDPLGMSISIMMHNPLPCLMVNLSAYCAHTIAMRVCEENWKILWDLCHSTECSPCTQPSICIASSVGSTTIITLHVM